MPFPTGSQAEGFAVTPTMLLVAGGFVVQHSCSCNVRASPEALGRHPKGLMCFSYPGLPLPVGAATSCCGKSRDENLLRQRCDLQLRQVVGEAQSRFLDCLC